MENIKTPADFEAHYQTARIGGRGYRVAPGNRKFWRKVDAGQWEPETFTVLTRFLRADSVYVDVGGWVGPTVLFAAAQGASVYCVEPDAVAYERLLANLRINKIAGVQSFHGALHAHNGSVKINNPEDFGNSETRVQPLGGDGIVVPALDIFTLVDLWGIGKIDLLKMDIEGAEFALMPMLIKFISKIKPVIHLSLHAPFLPQADRRENLTAVVELANNYKFTYDKRLNQITPEDILGAPFADKFTAITMSDSAF